VLSITMEFAADPPFPPPPVRLASGTDYTLHATIISLRAVRDPWIAMHFQVLTTRRMEGNQLAGGASFQSIKRGGFHSRVALIGSCERINLRSLREQDKGYEAHETQCRDSVLPHHHSSRTRNCHSHSSYNHIPLTPIHHNYHASRYPALLL
jgi:hypothetical protein